MTAGKNENLIWAYGQKGDILRELDRKDEALECYEKILQVDPGNAEAVKQRGLLLYYLGRFEEAKGYISSLSEAEEDPAEVLYKKATVYYKTGEDKYKDYAWKALAKADTKPRPKAFGLKWRNSAYALYYLSNAAKNEN